MRILKDEFTFQYNKQSIKVKLCGEVHCAIFGKTAKPLNVETYGADSVHKGKISTHEGKFLGWLPSEALEETAKLSNDEIIDQVMNLLKQIN